ncbi:MAG: hypothetical protein Q7T33_00420 [Dehalococcoidia bacterium]|nr:hypothetical protein [Dehalococcoidia bacterium]
MTTQHRPIDDRIAREIARLHKRYPKLGHHGILTALEDQGVRVDPAELKRFLKTKRMKPAGEFKGIKIADVPTSALGAGLLGHGGFGDGGDVR